MAFLPVGEAGKGVGRGFEVERPMFCPLSAQMMAHSIYLTSPLHKRDTIISPASPLCL